MCILTCQLDPCGSPVVTASARVWNRVEPGGTGWNRVEPGGTIRNPATSCNILHTTFLLLRLSSLAPFFLYPSLPFLLSFSLTYLLSFFQISSCPLLFLFFRNDFAVDTPAFFEMFFLRTRDQSRCKRYVLNGDVHHVEF